MGVDPSRWGRLHEYEHQKLAMRRAIALFVEDKPHLLANSHWLYESWTHIDSDDTDLVFMGPETALEKLPDDVIKIVQRPACDDPGWLDYVFINSLACLFDPSASMLNDYDILIRSDLDIFLTPAWNRFYPSEFMTGFGGYSNDDRVRENIQRIAHKFGLTHRSVTNIGTTIYGPAGLVIEICRLATDLTRYIRTVEFKDHGGKWPSWYAGVSSLYAQEIAVNHLVPSLQAPSKLLDYYSTSVESVDEHPHIHVWHGDALFSKFQCYEGTYDNMDESNLNLDIINEYCVAMALRARRR